MPPKLDKATKTFLEKAVAEATAKLQEETNAKIEALTNRIHELETTVESLKGKAECSASPMKQLQHQTDLEPKNSYSNVLVARRNRNAAKASTQDGMPNAPRETPQGGAPNETAQGPTQGAARDAPKDTLQGDSQAGGKSRLKSRPLALEGGRPLPQSKRLGHQIVGSAQPSSSLGLKAVQTSYPVTVMVSRLAVGTTPEELEAHVRDATKLEVKAAYRAPRRWAARYSTYLLTARNVDLPTLLDPTIWPQNTFVKRFYLGKKPDSLKIGQDAGEKSTPRAGDNLVAGEQDPFDTVVSTDGGDNLESGGPDGN